MKVPFLTGSVPYLRFDSFIIDGKCSCLKLDTDRCFGLDAELVSRESSEKLRFANGRVANQDYFEHIIYLLIEIGMKI